MNKSDKKTKILLLGGAYAQTPAIKAANHRGLYTILCDYLPDNPGRELADEYVNASTTDREQVLQIAKEKKADYVFAYASDPAASTAAYVSDKLGLPGNSFESVKILSEKHLFRQLLRECGLNCPKTLNLRENEVERINSIDIDYPVIVKPVDSSGSKGVKLVRSFSEFQDAAEYAVSFSKKKQIIIEEYINSVNGDIHGDGFVTDGKLTFSYTGDHIYNHSVNPFNPVGTTWPSKISQSYLEQINTNLQTALDKSGFKNGSINIEARINDKGEIYIMEIGPRGGGHFVPRLIHFATEFDIIQASLSAAMGQTVKVPETKKGIAAYYALHASSTGKLKKIDFSDQISPYIKYFSRYVEEGEEVQSFQASNAAIGILLMSFPNIHEMNEAFKRIEELIKIEIV